jgi:hypothetical protein
MSFETQVEVLTAESELRVAYQLFYGTPPLSRLPHVGKIWNAEARMKAALIRHREDGKRRVIETIAELAAAAGRLARGAELCAVKQARANFLVREASDSGDGWRWPVQVMEAGFAYGNVEGHAGSAHYYPLEMVEKVAEAVNGARFRRRHPREDEGAGSDLPELTAGWVSDGRLEGSTVRANVNLLHSESSLRSTLLAAQEAGKMDLFSVSIMAYFHFEQSRVEGRPALVATALGRFCGLDLCAEPGAGGRFLSDAAGVVQ